VSRHTINGFRVAGISTCLPPRAADNLDPTLGYDAEEVRKVVAMAGVKQRRVVDDGVTAADLSFEAAERLLQDLGWQRDSVSALVFVTQSPDHFLPSSSCLLQNWLGLPDSCAAFDVGLGCSGYPYGLYIAAAMLRAGGHRRVLMLHGDTPSRFVDTADHATTLLFGDSGSATALEAVEPADQGGGHFVLGTDGAGYAGLIMRGGGFRDRHPTDPRHLALEMDGSAVFNFTLKRVPPLVADALAESRCTVADLDAFVFHQSNRFMIRHLMKKCGLPEEKVPLTLEDNGNSGGPSVAVTVTRRLAGTTARERAMKVMLLGYGVGLSWGAAVLTIERDARLLHADYTGALAHRG
jgi:3-oxoacyl-[acyl-carrier-protein] synthase-3